MGIKIQGICKSFGDRIVLQNIDFEFQTGTINMIIGASGSGKTVLVKCLVGLIKPDLGNIFYDELDFLHINAKDMRNLRKQIGMLFQSSALFDSLTVAENIAFPMRTFTNQTEKEIQNRVAFCLERVGMNNTQHLFPSEISGGMKKRVGIARGIVLNPKYLFCDEPNSGLDPQTAAKIDELIQDITQEYKMTTIVVSHDMKSVLTIGDKILFIYQGRKEWEGKSSEITQSKNNVLIDFIKTSGVITG